MTSKFSQHVKRWFSRVFVCRLAGHKWQVWVDWGGHHEWCTRHCGAVRNHINWEVKEPIVAERIVSKDDEIDALENALEYLDNIVMLDLSMDQCVERAKLARDGVLKTLYSLTERSRTKANEG